MEITKQGFQVKETINKHLTVSGIVILLYIITSIMITNDFVSASIDDGSISGHVYQRNGKPIESATIEIIKINENRWWNILTESDGITILNLFKQGGIK